MTKTDSKLNAIEKQLNAAQPDQNSIIIDWSIDGDNRPIAERTKEKALKSGQRETLIEWAGEDIISYTYDPKLGRGWAG